MYIQPISYSVNMQGGPPKIPKKPGALSKFIDRIKQKVIDAVPEYTITETAAKVKKWSKLNDELSHPAINRLIMGASAILTQPAIDYYNHRVDKETREVSRNRTIAKIIAGTTVGMLVRGSCYELVSKMTNVKGNTKLSRALLPKRGLRDLLREETLMNNYRNSLATGFAILAMCITNFLIDAPLTVYLTNHFNKKRKENFKINEGNESSQIKERLVLNG